MKLISGIVGLVLLIASTLVVTLSTSDETYLEKKNTMVMKYVEHSTQALQNDDIKSAIKYAKLAIVVDPKNKNGFKAYEAALKMKYQPVQDDQEVIETNTNSAQQPQAEEEEEEEDMGC